MNSPVLTGSDRADEPITGFLPNLIEKRVKVNLEPLNEQISTLTQLLNQLIQKIRHITPQRRVRAFSEHKQEPHPVVRLEPVEPCLEEQSRVRDFHPPLGSHNFGCALVPKVCSLNELVTINSA